MRVAPETVPHRRGSATGRTPQGAENRRLLIVGASGLVGQGVLRTALNAPEVERVVLLLRRPLPQRVAVADPRVQTVLVPDFATLGADNADVVERLRGLDACCYAAGAMPIGMGAAAFRAITVDLTRRVTEAYIAANPQGRVFYVSGLGANAQSAQAALRSKGEAELAVAAIAGARACSLRPGIVQPVLGEVSPHASRRVAYALGAPVFALGVRLLPGLFTTTADIGRCMLQGLGQAPWPAVVENAQIRELASRH